MVRKPTGVVAAVDCGTNSTRLLVADQAGHTVIREMRITRLGQGVDQHALLAAAAVDRTLAVLREYRTLMENRNVERCRMVATSAVRDAHNGHEFLQAAAQIVGFEAELLSGEEEGRLAYSGATAHLPAIQGDYVVVDIGGGSTELILSRNGSVDTVSLEMGCVRLTERSLIGNPPTRQEVIDAEQIVRRQLEYARTVLPTLDALKPASRLIGLAGTVSTLALLAFDLAEYRRESVHHAVIPFRAVADWCGTLLAEPVDARARRQNIMPGREDVIAGGALILREVMSCLNMNEVVVSEDDILDGLVASLQIPGA